MRYRTGRTETRRRSRARHLLAPLLAVAVCLGGCFEDPVAKTLRIEIAENGSAWIDLEIEFQERKTLDPDSPLGRRIAAEREALLGGFGEWTGRFSVLSPVTETHSWIKNRGDLRTYTHSAEVRQAAELEGFFADTGVGAFAESGDGWASFAFYPSGPARGGSAEVRRVQDAVATWSEYVAGYLETTAVLYDYLDRHPERARVCFAHYFEDLLRDSPPDEVTGEEEELLTELVDRSAALLTVFEPPADEAWTANELSRRVFDPFPADIRVRVPGRLLEVEGFVAEGGGWLRVPGVGLWPALDALEGTWLAPDPALAWIGAETGDRSFSLDAFLATPRQVHQVPDPDEVEDALWEGLQPADSYRVVWAVSG